jgi:transcriptional regulator
MTNREEAISFMQKYSFATLVTVANGIPSATHLPFVVEQRDGKVMLISHLAKANPQANELLKGKALVIFAEPHAYISPKHYEHEKNVPTWNYIAVHAYGTATLIESPEHKAALLAQTITFYEAAYLQQWQALPDDYKLNMMKGITGFEIVVDDLQGKKKISQNRSETEQQNIISELSNSPDSAAKDIAGYMRS